MNAINSTCETTPTLNPRGCFRPPDCPERPYRWQEREDSSETVVVSVLDVALFRHFRSVSLLNLDSLKRVLPLTNGLDHKSLIENQKILNHQ
jgi:hypothetical protein